MNTDFQSLPRLKDSISYVYIEHSIIEQEDSSIVVYQGDGKIPVPIATVTCLFLGLYKCVWLTVFLIKFISGKYFIHEIFYFHKIKI